MTEPFQAGILATDYAKQEGVTVDAIYARVNAGQLHSYKVGRRVYVYPPAPIEQTTTLPAQIDGAQAPGLPALSDYNSRLVEPWVKRVSELEDKVREQAEELGDLRRQVRQLKRALEGMEQALRRVVSGGEE